MAVGSCHREFQKVLELRWGSSSTLSGRHSGASVRKTLGNRVADDIDQGTAIRTSAHFVLTSIAFVNVTISITRVTDSPDRYVVPVVIPIIGLLTVSVEKFLRSLTRRAPVLFKFTRACFTARSGLAGEATGWMDQYTLAPGAGCKRQRGGSSRRRGIIYVRIHRPSNSIQTKRALSTFTE